MGVFCFDTWIHMRNLDNIFQRIVGNRSVNDKDTKASHWLRAQYHRGLTSRQKTHYLKMLILGITIIMQCAGCPVLRYGTTTTAFADHGLSECTVYIMSSWWCTLPTHSSMDVHSTLQLSQNPNFFPVLLAVALAVNTPNFPESITKFNIQWKYCNYY